MTNPVYKIETWTGGVKDYTIEKEAINVQFKEVLTYGVGTFSFTVPTVRGKPDPYFFSDIAIDDVIKIWLRYDSVSGDPDFIGKVTKPNGRLSTAEGYVRQISGLSQGEVLLRKFKKDRLWSGVAASDIVEEICDDLGLGKTKVENDATSETIEVQTERYIDVLKRVSDYYDAGGSVKKDFYVDVDNNLVWKTRPLRKHGYFTGCNNTTGWSETEVGLSATLTTDGYIFTIEGTCDAAGDEFVQYARDIPDFSGAAYPNFLIRWKTSVSSNGLGARVYVGYDGGGGEWLLGETIPEFDTEWHLTSGALSATGQTKTIATVAIHADDYPNTVNSGTYQVYYDYIMFTDGVETLTIGDNIISYNVIRDVISVKNNITVYGAGFELPVGSHDGYTEATTDWTSNGTVTTNTDSKAGQYSIQATRTAGSSPMTVYLQRAFSSFRCGWRHQRYVNFYWKYFHSSAVPEFDVQVAILAPDWSNRFTKDVGLWKTQNIWFHRSMELGPHGGWASTGDPDWLDVQGWRITHANDNGLTSTLRVDELYFTGGHYYGTASSGSADRDFEVSDPRLTSDTLCSERAETILYQKSGQPIQIDLVIVGNPNVLVGDRIPITILAEEISEQNFDVIAVVQSLNAQSFVTALTMLNSENIREPLQTNYLEALINTQQAVKALSRDQKIVS